MQGKPVDTPSLARALFATDERVRKLALDRGEYTAGESTHAGASAAAARYRAVIAKAWARGAEGKAPEAEWRAEAEVRAAGVITELGRKP